MNSETASFEIFAFAGRAFFIIRLTFAIGRNRSCSRGDDDVREDLEQYENPKTEACRLKKWRNGEMA
ncbi:unnamed protein product [Amaranthus hypochondriacus]